MVPLNVARRFSVPSPKLAAMDTNIPGPRMMAYVSVPGPSIRRGMKKHQRELATASFDRTYDIWEQSRWLLR